MNDAFIEKPKPTRGTKSLSNLITISRDKIVFNTHFSRTFIRAPYVQILLNIEEMQLGFMFTKTGTADCYTLSGRQYAKICCMPAWIRCIASVQEILDRPVENRRFIPIRKTKGTAVFWTIQLPKGE